MMEWLHKASIWSVLLPALVGIRYFGRLSANQKLVWTLCLLAVVPQMVRIMSVFDGRRYFAYNVYSIVEVVLSALFLIQLHKRKVFMRQLVVVFIGAYMLVFGLLLAWHGMVGRFFYECVAMCNLMVTAGVMLVIYKAIQNQRVILLWRQPESFFIVGLFFYAPVTVLVFTLWNFLHTHPQATVAQVWIIHHIANFSMYVLFAIGLMLPQNRPNMLALRSKTHTPTYH
ncbi:MAG: hypothetical protein EAY75_00505 [Bacteroidetes bacterium]|nr:MAG: hypothetical protein EAY75_00505 [Bacteroidota bacterium]